MTIEGMNHFTIITDNLDRTRKFYIDLLGLKDGERPAFGFPGAWLYCGGRAILHVISGRELPDERGGILDHMAFSARDLPATAAKLKAQGIDYELRRLPAGGPLPGLWQMFFFDPNGAKVELDFVATESAP